MHPTSPDSRTPIGIQDNPPTPFPDLTVVKDFPFSQTDPMTPTPQVLSSLSLHGQIPRLLWFYSTATPPELHNTAK
jgi:hypothetical protein